MEDITLVIATCDRYSDLWSNATKLINKYWKTPCRKVFLGETKTVDVDGFETILCGKKAWTDIIREGLNSITTKYVYFMVEDFFLTSEHSEKMIQNGIKFLEANGDANKLLYVEDLNHYLFSQIDDPFYKMDDQSGYLTSVHPAIWKTDYLKECLDEVPNKNPWQFEIDGGDLRKGRDNKIYVKHLKEQKYLNIIVNSVYNPKWNELRDKESLIETNTSGVIKPDVTLLITSCDKYSYLWDNLATQVNKYWKVNSDKVIVSETLQFKHAGFTTHICGNCSWTDMLIKSLTQIKTEYVFLKMDDFFLYKKLDDGFITNATRFLRDEKANKLLFSPASTYYTLHHVSEDIFKFDDHSDYLTSLQPGLWRTDYLRECLVGGMNPWQFEVEGSNRMKGRDNRVYLYYTDHVAFNVVVKGQIDPHWEYFRLKEGLSPLNK